MPERKQRVLINEKEACALMGYKEGALRVRRVRKQPPVYYKIGGKVMYDIDDIKDYIESGRVMPTNDKAKLDE